MNIMKYYVGVVCLWWCCMQVAAQGQKQCGFQQTKELSSGDIKEIYQSYRAQADRWKQKLAHNPQDEVAWTGYGNSFWMYCLLSSAWCNITDLLAIEQEKNEMFSMMKRCIPNTVTQAVLQNRFFTRGESQRLEMDKKIMDKWPDVALHYPYYLLISQFPHDEKRMAELCKRWYQSGTFPQQCLNFSYNAMIGTDKDAVIIWNGSYLDNTSCQVLQYAKGLFPDKKILNMNLMLADSVYQKEIFGELGVPDYKMDMIPNWGKILRHVIRHVKRPVYFPVYMSEMLVHGCGFSSKNLYSEGLLLKYSEIPYNNLAVMRRNFEHTYLLDYLHESFYPEEQTENPYLDPKMIRMPELYYVPGFKALLQFYKESGDVAHYDELHSLLESIIKRADYCDAEIRERYLKSIDI